MGRVPVFLSSQAIKMVRFPIFPGSQAINMDRFPIFPGSQAFNPTQKQLKNNTRHLKQFKYKHITIKNNRGVRVVFFNLVDPV